MAARDNGGWKLAVVILAGVSTMLGIATVAGMPTCAEIQTVAAAEKTQAKNDEEHKGIRIEMRDAFRGLGSDVKEILRYQRGQ